MRNLILSAIVAIYSIFPIGAQPLKVEGSANYVTQFEGNYFTVARNDGYAVIDLDGKVIASGLKAPVVGFMRQLPLYHGTLFTDDGGKIVLKNVKGQPLGIGKYMEIVPFTTDNTVARVPTPPGAWIVAYIDTTGKEIVRFDVKKYLSIVQPLNKTGPITFVILSQFLPFSEGLTPIRSQLTGKYGYIDKKLDLMIPVGFSDARPFSDGLAAVQNEDGNWGFINSRGKLVIPYTYSMTPSRFMSGLARIETRDGKMGYINKGNVIVIQPKYQYATCFYKGFALAREGYNQPICLIDTTGAVIATFPKDVLYIDNAKPSGGISGNEPPEFPFYVSETLKQLVDEGKGIFLKGTSYGLIDIKGKVVLDFNYLYLSDYHDGKMLAHYSTFSNNSTKNQLGIIDDKGNWLIEIQPSGM